MHVHDFACIGRLSRIKTYHEVSFTKMYGSQTQIYQKRCGDSGGHLLDVTCLCNSRMLQILWPLEASGRKVLLLLVIIAAKKWSVLSKITCWSFAKAEDTVTAWSCGETYGGNSLGISLLLDLITWGSNINCWRQTWRCHSSTGYIDGGASREWKCRASC